MSRLTGIVSGVALAFAIVTCVPGCGSDDSGIVAPPQTKVVAVSGGWTGVVVPRLIQGDREFDGNGPSVLLTAALSMADDDSVICYLAMSAEETASNWSKASGEYAWTLYRAPAGWKITALIAVGDFCQVHYVDNNHSTDYHGCPGFLFASVGDIDGDDIEVVGGTSVTVRVDDFDVELLKNRVPAE